MPAKTLANLGVLVRKKRGDANLRDTAKEIGIGPATLMRVENGRIPDVATFGKICNWLKVDPGTFLGFESPSSSEERSLKDEETEPKLLHVSAHLKVDQTPQPETVNALAKMILLAAKSQRGTQDWDEE